MARQRPIPERELAICKRLREFRLSTMIPRTAFAIAVGISSDRLSAHENGRVPVTFGVFRAIHGEFHVNPRWLVEGVGPMEFDTALDLSGATDATPDRKLLSSSVAGFLRQAVDSRMEDEFFVMISPGAMAAKIEEYAKLLESPNGFDLAEEKEIATMIARLTGLLERVRNHRATAAKARK